MDRELSYPRTAIAVVGMGARFPGARNLQEFWENIRGGVESIRRLSDAELLAAGVDSETLSNPNYVKAASVLDGIELFDARFFGFSPKDAAIMDPQHRIFLECSCEALENAGWSADEFPGSIGVFAGSGINAYLMFNLLPNQQLMSTAGLFLLKQTGNDKDVLATRVSYQLNLTGPSMTVQTACSTSLVAVHVACQSLLNGECDMALAGGVTIEIPHKQGYIYRAGEILSRDGHCRAFDAESSGTIFGSGSGVVVLRRLADALADGDRIHAVVLGSAINNDGARKVGYLAPSVNGQAEVVAEALALADVPADSISYVETHGTGTPVGDPIEIAALTQAFRETTERKGFCGIGSLKTNIGHLDAAAGIAGFIKTVLALENRQLPPSLHFTRPNPRIDFANSPFYVNSRLADWTSSTGPLRAGVTSLGIGGTNAHAILEEPPLRAASSPSRIWQVLSLSAKTPSALDAAAGNLADHLAAHPELNLPDAAFTCHRGRKAFTERCTVVCRTREEAIQGLRNAAPKLSFRGQAATQTDIAFLFPGQGAQYVQMARGIYETEGVFRAQVDACAQLLAPHLGLDLRTLLFPEEGANLAQASARLTETRIAQPALFVIEYALAKLWMAWGIQPAAMIGHSLGEFVAACLAGVLSLEDALKAVAARGRLMQSAAPGAMLAVQLAEPEARGHASGEVSLAAVNGAKQCVLSGPASAIDAIEKKLTANGVVAQRLQTSHAFHSASMDPILAEFTAIMREIQLQPPKIPYVSNVTGTWVTAAEATDPAYWARHVRQPVLFAAGVAALLERKPIALLEVGPGRVLAGLVARHPAKTENVRVISALRSAQEPADDQQFLLSALAQLWTIGAKVDWGGFHAQEKRQRVELPTYPFEHQRYWIDAPKPQPAAAGSAIEQQVTGQPAAGQPAPIAYYRPVWKRADVSAAPAGGPTTWLIFLDAIGVGAKIVKHLEGAGQVAITLAPGERFARTGKTAYTLDPSNGADYERLLEALTGAGQVPDRVLYLWPLAASSSAPASPEDIKTALALSFYSQLYLAQAIGTQDLSSPMSLAVVSNGLASVAGEAVERPERAVLLGPCTVIPKEFGNISTRWIDVDTDGGLDRAVRQILAEAGQEFGQTCERVAYRGDNRWAEILQPASIDPAAGRLRQYGVYLITGGTGGIGMEIAEHLARTQQARLVLVSRTGKPRQPDAIARLLEFGAEVEIATADVTDLTAIRAVVARAREKFGRIDGVIHAAGVLDDGLIQLKHKDAADRVLAPKITGTLVLEQALADAPPEFMILFSSVSCYTAPVGQVDYVAANAFLDAYAAAKQGQSAPWTVAINWGRWGETGMAADSLAATGHPLLGSRSINTPDTLAYRTELSFRNHWVLNEHCLRGGDALFPGTGYIELVRAALTERLGSGAVEFEEVSFVSPLRVERAGVRTIDVRLARDGQSYHFTVSDSETTSPYCSGSVRFLGVAAPRINDVSAALARASRGQLTFSPDEQNAKQARYIDFGPRWRCLRQIALGANEAVSSLELNQQYEADRATYRLHPALLDAATGSAMFTIPGYAESSDLYVPLSYRKIAVFADLPRRVWCHIRWPESNHASKDIVTFDITLAGENGEVVAEIQGFGLRRLSDTAMLAADVSSRAFPVASAAIASAAGVAAFAAIVDGPPVHRVLAVPSGLQLDAPARPSPAMRPSSAPPSSSAAPLNDVERTLAQWWRELLGVAQVSVHDDFFELGGHSLVAVRLFTKIEKHFGTELGLATLFEARTIADMGRLIRKAKDSRHSTTSEPVPAAVGSNGVPRDEIERTLAQWWRELLGVDHVSIHQDFFELGGHSLVALRLLMKIEKQFHKSISLSESFENRTIEALAEAIRGGKPKQDASKLQFRAAQPCERSAVGEFLSSVFGSPWFSSQELLQWKYFAERDDWAGPRSYLLKQGDTILAHGGVDPVALCTARGEISSILGYDWATTESVPGAGIVLLKNAATLAETYVVPGGSPKTRSILPEIGFRPFSDRYTYARVVRPWQHVRSQPSWGWKTPMRLGYNLLTNLAPRRPSNGWIVSPIRSFGDAHLPLLERRHDSYATRCRRSPGVMNYLLACPVAAVSAFLLIHDEEPQGYFVLSLVQNQARIADFWLTSDSPADWQAGYTLACETAAAEPSVFEILTVASTEIARQALDRNHFHKRDQRAVLVLDPKGLLQGAPALDLQLLDGDEYYLQSY